MDKDIENIFKTRGKNPYKRYGFLRNPFPINVQEFHRICYNQDDVKKIFVSRLGSFIANQEIETLLIHADHRVGKTNFLRYYYNELKDISKNNGNIFNYAYIREYNDNYLIFHKAIIDELGVDFFVKLFNEIKDNTEILDDIQETDFKKGIRSCIESITLSGGLNFEYVFLFFEWFKGIKYTQKKLEKIDVSSSITTSSLAIRYLNDLIKLSRISGVLKGLIIFMDEFESIFGESVSRGKRDKYLQDIRSLLDEIQIGIFIICAITPNALLELSKYQALKARFGESISLSSIRDIDEAKAYANEYINFAKEEVKNNNNKSIKNIISNNNIKKIYNDFDEEEIKQGYFFEKLHYFIEDKISESS